MLTRRPKQRTKLRIKKGDKVVVISGADRSNQPREVLRVDVENQRVVVQGVNVRVKHQRRSQQNPKGGRVEKEFPIHVSKVMLWSESKGRGVRVRSEIIDGKRVRVGTCGTRFD
jgi:large subunit ribosomal protein L24